MSDRLFGDDVIFQQRFLKSAQLYTELCPWVELSG
jgi:hypothetical protein